MIENLSIYLTWIFAVTTFATVLLYLIALWVAGQGMTLPALTATILVILLALHAILAATSFYLTKTIPPRFLLGLLPTIAILLLLFFAYARTDISVKSLRVLTLLSVVRVPVEFILLKLYQSGQIPQLMTFEGRNFDIISGLSAPLVAWLAFRRGRVEARPLMAWNVLALGLLLNIVANAVLSFEGPFQQFAFEQPNRAVLYFPFVWLPAIIVPVVFVSHVISLWQLFKKRD